MMTYTLVFEDLFNQKKLNTSIWTPETGGHGFGNKESQYYTSESKNIDLSSGHLKITSIKEPYQGNTYTSAKLITYPNQLLSYGKIEVEAILPKGHGTWPAIWLLGKNYKEGTPWPLCGEIDIIEHVGHNPGVMHFSLHSKSRHFTAGNQRTFLSNVDEPFSKKHLYTMIWHPGYIAFEVDGVPICSYTKEENEPVESWPFDQPFYLIMNTAIGGTWGGPIDDKSLPTTFDIFRIAYYKLNDE
jgi:beta-glucanase (GH16 family)